MSINICVIIKKPDVEWLIKNSSNEKKKITTHGQGKPCVVKKVVTSTTQGDWWVQ